MGEQQLRDEVIPIYLAAQQMTANTLSGGWYLLSENPEAARDVREEASSILGGRMAGPLACRG